MFKLKGNISSQFLQKKLLVRELSSIYQEISLTMQDDMQKQYCQQILSAFETPIKTQNVYYS